MNDLVDNFCLTVVAPRRSGKSYLINHMLIEGGVAEWFDHIYIFCPSILYNKDYDNVGKKPNVTLNWAPDKSDITDIIDTNSAISAACKNETHIFCPSVLLILDDIIDSGILQFKGIVDVIAERGRHINMSLIVSSQRLTAVSRSIRINSDYFLIFAPASISEIEKFVEQFLPRWQRSKTITMLNQLYSEKYNFLLLDATATSWDDKLKYSTAQQYVNNIVHPIHLLESPETNKIDE